ncbi:MAG: NAD(P)H-hydrate dehydratase [Planctomycetota bacterium]
MSSERPRSAPRLPRDAHKGDAGRVLLVCGSEDMPGAAVLAARAAARAGAGLVSVACVADSVRRAVPVASPETILLDWTDGDLPRIAATLRGRSDDARLAGPGLGASERTRALVSALLADDAQARPTVLDADALNVIAPRLEALRGVRGALVLTPHPGEAARLLARDIPSDDSGRIAAAREISARSGAICCLKGHRTVVADAERVYVNTSGNPGMATAGTGDVLAGLLVAYLAVCGKRHARDWRPFDAATSAVFVHGLAGDLAARQDGERGLIASDLIAHLPAAQREHAALDPHT